MDDPVANKNTDQTAQESAVKSTDALSRRRLLKGAMAVSPAVMTLQSGAARAAISHAQCLSDLPEFDSKSDGYHVGRRKDNEENPDWVRTKVSGMLIQNLSPVSGMKKKYWLVKKKTGSYYNQHDYQDQQGNEWLYISHYDNPWGQFDGYVLKEKQPWLWENQKLLYSYVKNVNRYKVQYVSVDQHGNYQQTGGNGKSPVTVSCWTSFTSPKSGGDGYWWG